MTLAEPGFFRAVKVDDLPWRPSAMASGVFVKDVAVTDGWEMQIVRLEPGARLPVHTHQRPEFLFVLEGELVQGGRRMGAGWASVGRGHGRRGGVLGHGLRVRARRCRSAERRLIRAVDGAGRGGWGADRVHRRWRRGNGRARPGGRARRRLSRESRRAARARRVSRGGREPARHRRKLRPLEDPTLHSLAADVIGVIDHLGSGPVHLLGHGFSNRVVRCLAADRPDLVRSVILLAGAEAVVAFLRSAGER